MIYKRGYLARPLDALFSNVTRVAVLRVLATEEGSMSGRAIGRMAGVNHQAAANALEALRELGVVQRSGEGRETGWSLARRSYLGKSVIEAVFRQESHFAKDVAGFIRGELRDACAGVILYGAAAKGRLEPGGVLKFAAVAGKTGRLALAAKVRAVEGALWRGWGLRSEGRAVSSSEAGKLSLFEEAWRLLPDEGRDWVG